MTYILSFVTLGVAFTELSLSIHQSNKTLLEECSFNLLEPVWESIPVLHTHPAKDGTRKMKVTVVFTKTFNLQWVNYYLVLERFQHYSCIQRDDDWLSSSEGVCVFCASIFWQYLSSEDEVVCCHLLTTCATIMDLKVVFVIVCLCALAITSTEGKDHAIMTHQHSC